MFFFFLPCVDENGLIEFIKAGLKSAFFVNKRNKDIWQEKTKKKDEK